jgi:hypothetical protein
MGYTTDFAGEWTLNKPLDDFTYNFLRNLSDTRRMGRTVSEDKYGIEGEFYIEDLEDSGQRLNPNIIDYNRPPITQPGLWCDWKPTEDRKYIEWNQSEKFYYYIEWIEYILSKILLPLGYKLDGTIDWRGEDFYDTGEIVLSYTTDTQWLYARGRNWKPNSAVSKEVLPAEVNITTVSLMNDKKGEENENQTSSDNE